MATFSGIRICKVGHIDNPSFEIPPKWWKIAQDGRPKPVVKMAWNNNSYLYIIKWDYNPPVSHNIQAIEKDLTHFYNDRFFWGPPWFWWIDEADWPNWPLKMGRLKTPQKETRNVLQWSIFNGKLAVSFRECSPRKILKTIFVIYLVALRSV